jgi:hypothetical protein
MNKGYLLSNIFFGAAFLIVAISIFTGAYRSNISLGIIFIIWTLNGFLQGIMFERRQRSKFDEKVLKEFMEMIEEADKEIKKRMEEKDGQL